MKNKADTFSLIATLRQTRPTWKYTTKPRNIFLCGVLNGALRILLYLLAATQKHNMQYAPLILSIISMIIALLSFFINRKKIRLDVQNFKADFYLGAEKLREMIEIAKGLKNIDPHNITLENFNNDRKVLSEVFRLYEANENKIARTIYTLPRQVTELKVILRNLESSFNDASITDVHASDLNKINNYRSLYFTLSFFSYPVNMVDQSLHQYDESADGNTYFMKLYTKFDNINLYVDFNRMQQLMERTEKALSELGKN